MTENPIRILLVDDHALFAEGLREMLSFHDDLEIVGIAESGDRAMVEVGRLHPRVVLMDLHMPGSDGITATRRITAQHPQTAVLALTMYEDEASILAVLRAGGRGYVLKGAHQAELVAAVRAVSRGEAVFGAHVADHVLGYFAKPQPKRPVLPELTDREREVLARLADGHPTARIAAELGLAPKTVRNHLSNIFAKLQVTDRIQAVRRAREAGLSN